MISNVSKCTYQNVWWNEKRNSKSPTSWNPLLQDPKAPSPVLSVVSLSALWFACGICMWNPISLELKYSSRKNFPQNPIDAIWCNYLCTRKGSQSTLNPVGLHSLGPWNPTIRCPKKSGNMTRSCEDPSESAEKSGNCLFFEWSAFEQAGQLDGS